MWAGLGSEHGTNFMILKYTFAILSPKNLAKKVAFFAQTIARLVFAFS
jgi:hypothetical protein